MNLAQKCAHLPGSRCRRPVLGPAERHCPGEGSKCSDMGRGVMANVVAMVKMANGMPDRRNIRPDSSLHWRGTDFLLAGRPDHIRDFGAATGRWRDPNWRSNTW